MLNAKVDKFCFHNFVEIKLHYIVNQKGLSLNFHEILANIRHRQFLVKAIIQVSSRSEIIFASSFTIVFLVPSLHNGYFMNCDGHLQHSYGCLLYNLNYQ